MHIIFPIYSFSIILLFLIGLIQDLGEARESDGRRVLKIAGDSGVTQPPSEAQSTADLYSVALPATNEQPLKHTDEHNDGALLEKKEA